MNKFKPGDVITTPRRTIPNLLREVLAVNDNLYFVKSLNDDSFESEFTLAVSYVEEHYKLSESHMKMKQFKKEMNDIINEVGEIK